MVRSYIIPNGLPLILNAPFPPNCCGLHKKGSPRLAWPLLFLSRSFVAFSGSSRISKLPKIHTEPRRVRTRARSASLDPRAPRAGCGRRAHSILRARAHPSAEGIGRAHPARPGETPERLRRLPVPTAVKTSLPSLSQPSGAEAAAAALPEVCARLSAGRWPVRGAAGPGCCPSQAARVRASEAAQPEPGAFCLAQSGCLHHISDTSLSCSPLLPPVHSAPRTRRRPPADCRPPGLKPADGSARAMPPVQKVAAAAAAGGR